MGEKMVRLHTHWGSPFCNRVEIALEMKGVEYDKFEEVPPNKSPELLRHNPVHKKMPVLVHGSNGIAESQVILEYIDDTWDSGSPILPRDPYERALARFWAKFIDDKLVPSIHRALIFGEESAMEEVVEHMKALDKELQGKRFFGGERIGFVDIVANMVGYWLGLFEEAGDKVVLTDEAFPWVCKWRNEFLGCEVVQKTLPTPKDKLVANFKDIISSIRGKSSE